MSLKQIKDTLSACYKERKPVLLYGKESDVRMTGLLKEILDVHVGEGGKPYIDVKYTGHEKETIFLKNMANELDNGLYKWRDKIGVSG